MQSLKIQSNSTEHSRLIQTALFELGYRWTYDPTVTEFKFTGMRFLYAEANGYIVAGMIQEVFDRDFATEMTLPDLLSTIDRIKQS